MHNYDKTIQDAMAIAQSPAGQEILHLLRSKGGADLERAMEKAAAGDYTEAKQLLSSLMTDPQAKALLDQLGR